MSWIEGENEKILINLSWKSNAVPYHVLQNWTIVDEEEEEKEIILGYSALCSTTEIWKIFIAIFVGQNVMTVNMCFAFDMNYLSDFRI